MVAAGRAGDEAGIGAGGGYSDCVVGDGCVIVSTIKNPRSSWLLLEAAMAAVVRALQC
jgi:hypothetical protein